MSLKNNPGLDPKEIEQLKKECLEAGAKFVYFEEELNDEPDHVEEFVHVQFVGNYKGQEAIFDAVIYSLRLHFNSIVYETAERKALKTYPLYVPMENRDETYEANDEMDEEVKLAEHLEIDENFEYGIGLDVCLNVEEVDDAVVTKFVNDYLAGTLKLDPTMYSFKTDFED